MNNDMIGSLGFNALFPNTKAMLTRGERALADAWDLHFGCITDADLKTIASDDRTRLTMLLIRFHEGRLLAGAQDVTPIIEALTRAGWCVRDVSIPASNRPRGALRG